MPKLILDDDELRAVQDLLTDATRQPKSFPLSPKRLAYRTVLEKIEDVLEEEQRPKARRMKDLG